MQQDMKLKSFFDRPEGKTGLLFILAGVIGFLWFGNVILPWVIVALQNTLHAMLLGGTVLAIVALGMNKKFRLLCSNLFKSSMRAITSAFITIDPIGILKNYIEDMQERIEDIEGNISKLKGQIGKVDNVLSDRSNAANEAMRMASVAKKQGKADQISLYMRKAARAEEFVKKLSVTKQKMELLYKILDKMKRNVNLLLEDTKDEVQTKEMEYESIKAAHKAMSGAQKLISGDPQKELFELSMEYIADDIGTKLGEMDRFMDVSQDFMDKVDLQNGVWDEKGFEMLQQWEQTGSVFAYEESREKSAGLSSNYKPPQLPEQKVRVSSAELPIAALPAAKDYDHFFSKK